MKNTIFGLAIITLTITACNTGNNTGNSEKKVSTDTTVGTTASSTPLSKADVSIKDIVAGYLRLKNALTADNGKDAATAGNEVLAAMNKMDTTLMNAAQKQAYLAIADDTKENAEHIGANAGKIAHQREHFDLLSKDMGDLIKTFGNGGQRLYKDFCPMYDNGKGAYWISEIKDIKNPYFGKEMPECGEVKEELK